MKVAVMIKKKGSKGTFLAGQHIGNKSQQTFIRVKSMLYLGFFIFIVWLLMGGTVLAIWTLFIEGIMFIYSPR